jgi:hypothetical protein
MGKTEAKGAALRSRTETPEERFRRLAMARTNEVLGRLRILGNCANRQVYRYTEKDVEKIFATIERQVKQVRSKFYFPKEEKFRL